MKKVQFIIISTILAFGLIISSALISNAINNSHESENQITVKGVAEKRIKADIGVVNINYFVSGKEYEKLETEMDEKRDFIIGELQKLGIESSEYKVENRKINVKYIGETNKISSYEINQNIVVSLKNNEKLDKTYEELQKLKLKYNNLEIVEPVYYIKNIEKYKTELLVEATKNAGNKVFEILKINNTKIGDTKKIVQGPFEVVEDKEDIGNLSKQIQNQTYKRLRVVVTATYSIEKIK